MRDEMAARRDAILAARAFEEAHSAIDGAIGRNATLIAELLDVRARHVSGIAGQPLLERMIAVLTTMSAARQQAITAHDEAGKIGQPLGLTVRNEGGGTVKPPVIEEPASSEERRAA